MPRPWYPIETERLLIRPFEEADLEDLFAIQNRPDVARYLYWAPRSREEVRQVLSERIPPPGMDADGDVLDLAAVLRGSGVLVGSLVLFLRSVDQGQGEIGFVIHPAYQGQGLAAEGARELLKVGFDGLGLHRIYGRCDGRNAASAKLMERLGMRREAHLIENEMVKGEWTDELIFAVLQTEWGASSHGPG
jgi:RimJ/RimL family protein N-acetyltransferase